MVLGVGAGWIKGFPRVLADEILPRFARPVLGPV